MRIDHIAIWTHDLERLKDFYQSHFNAQAGEKYTNPRTGFASYFLRFSNGARFEIMTRPGLQARDNAPPATKIGYAHVSFAVGSKQEVDRLTAELVARGLPLLDGPPIHPSRQWRRLNTMLSRFPTYPILSMILWQTSEH